MAIFLSNKYSLRFCCVRQIQNKIEESVYTLLKIQIDRFGLRHRFRILNNKIINRVTGSEFVFYGLWRNIEEMKSLEGIDVLWLEEAHALTEYQYSALASAPLPRVIWRSRVKSIRHYGLWMYKSSRAIWRWAMTTGCLSLMPVGRQCYYRSCY